MGKLANQSILWKFILRYLHTMEFADSKPFIKWTRSFNEEAGFTPVMLLHVNIVVGEKQVSNGNSSMV